MSLVYNEKDMIFWANATGKDQIPSLKAFKLVERRIAEKKTAIEDLQNELYLLKKQGFSTYRSEVRYIVIGQESMWKSAQNWLSMLKSKTDKDGNKIDMRKKYTEKSAFEYLQSKIRELLGIEDFKIDEILTYNYGEAYEIRFSYLDYVWNLSIPIINNVKMDSYDTYGASCFKLRLSFFESPHCSLQVGSTFEEDELKDILELAVEKYCNAKSE